MDEHDADSAEKDRRGEQALTERRDTVIANRAKVRCGGESGGSEGVRSLLMTSVELRCVALMDAPMCSSRMRNKMTLQRASID